MEGDIQIEQTKDGSSTLFVPSIDEHYHSVNGAIQESNHVFIEAGLKHIGLNRLSILEIGFGTGLNAYLTLLHAINNNLIVDYTGFELYPLPQSIIRSLNYSEQIVSDKKYLYEELHKTEWNKMVEIEKYFYLKKIHADFCRSVFDQQNEYDLIYFDAFAPEKQPEMWSQTIFDNLYTVIRSNGILVTYCAKGAVRRMLQSSGFVVERIPGPPGKREMLRASKK